MRLWQLQLLLAAVMVLGLLAASEFPRAAPPAVVAMCKAGPADSIEKSACSDLGL